MANSNVRFYKLATLPTFEAKYKGIFVHVTFNLTRRLLEDKVNYEYSWDGKLSDKDIQAIVIQKGKKNPVLVPEWMDARKIDIVESGLWFGGENGWELLSNDTTDAAITAAINALNAGGFTQATIGANPEGSESATDSILTIKGIKEEKGIIKQDDTKNFVVAIDGVYNESTNKIATKSTVTTTVTNAINGLNANTVQAVTFNTSVNNGNTTLTFKGIKETNGVIAQGDEQTPGTFIVGDAKLNIEIGVDSFEVFPANAKENKSIKLDENVFKKNVVNGKNVLSVITKNNDVSSDNPLVTEKDIANLAGAMYYKGSIASDTQWPANENVKVGYVWIASGNFEHGAETIESGDLIVFNTDGDNSKYTVVQSNITLGIGDGQVAANVGALAEGKLVVGVNSETGKGIKTLDFDVTNLTGTTGKNERNLTLTSQRPDRELQSGGAEGMQGLYHSVGITDNFTIMGRPMSKSFSISSPNRSISIERLGDENSTDAQIDLIWNTVMDA